MATMTESQYQAKLIKKIEKLFPGCVILKNDPTYQQGMLDLIILWENCWASLEVKISPSANLQPNQEYYVERLGKMSYAAIIYPDNETEILSALQQAFRPPRRTCISKS